MLWTETTNQSEADARYSAMWGTSLTTTSDGITGAVKGDGLYEGQRFWADAIRDTYDDPPARLAIAMRHLPLPAAFREAAIALRAIIRAKRKAGEEFSSELSDLHKLAAIGSIADYDALEITAFSAIVALDLEPATIGWEQLLLLNRTDAKLMAERWPAPRRHTTGAALYPNIKARGARSLASHRERSMADSMNWIDQMFAEEEAASVKPKPKGFFARLFGG